MILDHVDMLELTDEQGTKYNNELYTLRNLTVGLQCLYRHVDKVEQAVIGPTQGKLKVVAAGNIPGVPKETLALLTCAFHWYAVSAYNYVLLVGWLAQQECATTTDPRDYAKTVIPAVVTYRHKVAAHLAKVFPRKDDTPADLMESVIFPVVFDDDAFWAGAWEINITIGGQLFSTTHDMRWSLTKTHAELVKRYWPGTGDEL